MRICRLINIKNLSLVVLLLSLGCKDSSSGGGEPFSEIADMSVECDATEPGAPASCDATQEGKPVMLAWSSDSCASGSMANIAAYENTTLSCVAGICAAHDSVQWRSPETDEIIYNIGGSYSTAMAWLNLVDNGSTDDSGPQTGDVFCCLENQTTYGDMYSDHCSVVP